MKIRREALRQRRHHLGERRGSSEQPGQRREGGMDNQRGTGPPQKPQIAEEVHCVAVALLVADQDGGGAGSPRTRADPDQPGGLPGWKNGTCSRACTPPSRPRNHPAAAGSCRRRYAMPAGRVPAARPARSTRSAFRASPPAMCSSASRPSARACNAG